MEKAKQMGSNLLLDSKGLKQLEKDAQKFLNKKVTDYRVDVYRYKDEEVTIERKTFKSVMHNKMFLCLSGKIHGVTFELYALENYTIYAGDGIFKDDILKVLRTYGVKNDGWLDEIRGVLFGPNVEKIRFYRS